MKLTPRSYQQAAHDAVINWWRRCIDPCVIHAATGAGKSIIIAMLAKTLHDLSNGKRVLCLAPSKELVEQNHAKYRLIGERASIYSASISKSLRHQVVFATEGTFKRVASRIGHEFSGVIIDECHRTTPTIKRIIGSMREDNPTLRVCGLSATPYRLGDGFIFGIDTDDNPIPEFQALDPYYTKLVYYIGADELIARGYLTPAVVADINAPSYDTSNLKIQRNGHFSKATVDQAFEGWGRKTASIVADVVAQSTGRQGVMIFAATVEHANEVMASLPPGISRLVTGSTKQKERAHILRQFKQRRVKYLVNVSVLTTGFDAPHVDTIALLRATESISLLQQMIGRGLRIDDNKTECMILDYAGNIDKHCPDGDLFRPEIRASYQGNSDTVIKCKCPECGGENVFTPRKNEAQLGIDEFGYFIDLDHNRITADNGKEMPAHYGRRCQAQYLDKVSHTFKRCGYFWDGKTCPVCEQHNDIAARRCENCREELIDPAKKLTVAFKRKKRDPKQTQCDEVLQMDHHESISRAGNAILRVQFTTTTRMFTVYYMRNPTNQGAHRALEMFNAATDNGAKMPGSVVYKKVDDFYRVLAFDKPTDEEQLQDALSRLA